MVVIPSMSSPHINQSRATPGLLMGKQKKQIRTGRTNAGKEQRMSKNSIIQTALVRSCTSVSRYSINVISSYKSK
jgi:hypothetical protein